MRRKDREITKLSEIKSILEKTDVMRIALNNGAYPYVVPVNFGFEMNGADLVLFFHGAKVGTKHDVILRDNHTTFEIDCGHMLMPPVGEESCTASFAYESVVGQGLVEQVGDSEKEALLVQLVEQYGIAANAFHPAQLANTAVYKIKVETFTAKRRINDRI